MKTINSNFIAIVLIIAFIASCSDDSVQGDKINLEALSKTITIKGGYTKLDNEIFLPDRSVSVTNVIPQSRKDLESVRTVVKIYYGSANAGLTIPGFGGLKLGKDEANLNIYYIEYKVVNNLTDSIVYGIGYSSHYLFKKVKKGLNLTNLPYIAASVQIENEKTQVFYSLQTYGVIGTNLVKYFKPIVNENFDVKGYGILQSSIDGIQNVLGDTILSKSVKFTPGILKFVKPYDLY